MNIYRLRLPAVLLLAAVLAACSTPRPGAYYQDDGPPERVPAGLDNTPDAVPRVEPLASGANQPYEINGKRYVPDLSGKPYRVRGRASWYGTKFHGKKTSNGETYDMYAMTAAHPTLPLPSYVRVTRVATRRSVIVRVNDRGPFHPGRIIDLSYAAAYKLGMHMLGSDEVIVERIMPDDIQGGQNLAATHQPPQQTASVVPVAVPAPIIQKTSHEPAAKPAPKAAARPTPSALPVRLPVVVPAAKPTQTTRAISGSFYLQVGAFREPGNAQALRSRLSTTLGSREPSVSIQQRGSLHHVRIGPYASRADALKAIDRLSNQTGVTPILVKP